MSGNPFTSSSLNAKGKDLTTGVVWSCMENHSSVTGWQELFLVELALAELEMQAFSFRRSSLDCSHAFLPETVKTGIKNRDDLRCMQISLVMSIRFIFGDD